MCKKDNGRLSYIAFSWYICENAKDKWTKNLITHKISLVNKLGKTIRMKLQYYENWMEMLNIVWARGLCNYYTRYDHIAMREIGACNT